MIWRAMQLRSLKVSALLAVAVPILVAVTAITTMAASSPSPSGTPLPGDPAKGAALYGPNCASCHGASLTGGVGPALNPIEKMGKVPDTLDPAFLIDIIANGRQPQSGDPRQTAMPAKGGNANLTAQDVKDLAAFIIEQNRTGEPPLSPNELAKRTMLWVGIGIAGMVFITLLLSQYNMRWIARRAAARRK
jgi:mono/diheme cytochrome c family protein